MKLTSVISLRTGEVRDYLLPPEAAVIAAHAQSRGDWNTWEYQDRYKNLL